MDVIQLLSTIRESDIIEILDLVLHNTDSNYDNIWSGNDSNTIKSIFENYTLSLLDETTTYDRDNEYAIDLKTYLLTSKSDESDLIVIKTRVGSYGDYGLDGPFGKAVFRAKPVDYILTKYIPI